MLNDARGALNFLSQNGLTPVFRFIISQTLLKVVQYTKQTNVPSLLLYGPSILVNGTYFDDFITLESVNFRAFARPFFLLVLTALGAPPSPAKSIPLGQHRAWLGAALNLATVKDDMHFTLQPKESSVTQIIQGCQLAIARGFVQSRGSIYSPWTGRLDFYIIGGTIWADWNAFSQRNTKSIDLFTLFTG